MPKSQVLKPLALRDLSEIDGADGWWQVTGPAAALRLLPSGVLTSGVLPHGAGLPVGWLRLSMKVQAPRSTFRVPGFKADRGAGYETLRTVLPRGTANGRCTMMIHLPSASTALSMSPLVAQGPFRLGPVKARRMSRPEVAARLAVSFGQRCWGKPRYLLQSAGVLVAAWRGRGRAGLRQALGQAILGDGPVATGPAVAATERYQQWIAEHEEGLPPGGAMPGAQRVSVLLPVKAGDAGAVAATLGSLAAQPGVAWECRIGLAPGAGAIPETLAGHRGTLLPLATQERGAMLAALAKGATGDLMLVLDPGDQLAPGALAALASVPDADIVYGDEDRIGPARQRCAPCLKPDWSPDMLEAFNYLGRPVALRRDAVERAGGFTPGRGAGAEWDLHLRLATPMARAVHLPRILCHRPVEALADRPPPDRPEAAELRTVLAEHWRRQGIAATVTTQPDGTQRAVWPVADPPVVSIIIPSRDQPELLEQCLNGLLGGTRYPRLEIIVVDTGSADPAIVALTARLGAEGAIRVVRCHAPFTYSAARNAGARAAQGTLLLFLNNDVAVIRPDWLEELVRQALRPGVGVVGTMLVTPDGRLRHAGVVIGMHLCGLLFHLAPLAEWGPFGSPMVPRTLSAVTGACQMVRRDVFEQVGGFDETYVMANSDVALCLGARAAGWRVAYTPFARLLHHASASHGQHDPPEDLTRTAVDIRRFGYRHDPFFHPALDAGSTIPRLRVAGEPGNAASLERDVRRHRAGLGSLGPLDLGNDADVADAVGLPSETLFWPPCRPEGIGDLWSAAGWCVNLLRRRPDLRRRFPDALSAGPGGAFARWMEAEGGRLLGVPDTAVALILAALAAEPAARARQIVLAEAGLTEERALILLPPGRAGLLSLLLRRDGVKLRLEEIWWLALGCAEDPARQLVLSYQFNPGWQALFPDGLTVFGRERMAAWLRAATQSSGDWTEASRWPENLTPAAHIRMAWNCRSDWRRHHPRPFASPAAARALLSWLMGTEAGLTEPERCWVRAQPDAVLAEALAVPGLNIVGHFCYASGLRTSVISIAQGLRDSGHELTLRDVAVDATHDLPRHADYTGFELYDTTLLHIQPEPYFQQAYARSGLRPRRPRTHRIGYWYWELDSVPPAWSEAVDQVDELWAATRFVGDALRARFKVPVFDMMPGLELPAFTRRGPEPFGIPTDRFTFLFAFHMMSIMERKNPLGLIRAFRQAFSAAEPVMLILKTSFGERHPALMAALHAAAGEADGRIMIIDRVFSTDETISLMDACRCYISLHRSEGLGLTMAEAMLLAKPVIATGYSGNLDFMHEGNSLLVDHRLIEIGRPIPPYDSGTRWADPSEAHAAQLMRRVWENQDFAAALGARAQTELRARMSRAEAGRKMAERLAAIEMGRDAGMSDGGHRSGFRNSIQAGFPQTVLTSFLG